MFINYLVCGLHIYIYICIRERLLNVETERLITCIKLHVVWNTLALPPSKRISCIVFTVDIVTNVNQDHQFKATRHVAPIWVRMGPQANILFKGDYVSTTTICFIFKLFHPKLFWQLIFVREVYPNMYG